MPASDVSSPGFIGEMACLSTNAGVSRQKLANKRGTRLRGVHASILDAVTMQIVAVRIEPPLGALDRGTDFRDHAPESRRMVHLDQMRDLVGGEIVQHEGRRQ